MSNTVPDGWSVSTIHDTCDVLDSKRVPLNSQERSLRQGIYPYYGANGVQGYIDDFIFEGEHVLLAEDGGYFDEWGSRPISYLVTGKFWVNNHAHILKAKNGHETKHVHYSLVHKNILKHINGGTRSKLNQSDMREIEYLTPPLPEQQKIATILSSVDDVIETTRAQIGKLKDLKTGMMQELLTKGVWSGGVPHTEFKDTPVGRIPAGWDVLPLDHLVKVNKPITYGIVQAGPHCEGGVPYIRVSDMTERTLTLKNMLRTFPETAEKYKRSAVVAGDIVYALRGVIGHVQLVPSELEGANLTQGTARISPNDQIAARYLFWAMKAPYVQHQNELEAKGSTFREVTLASLRKIAIIVPPINEQHQMASNMDSIKLKLAATEDKLTQLQSLKKALMQDLLTGKVRVKIDEKEQEPAVA
jgi:type I restriction enzyme S subunit